MPAFSFEALDAQGQTRKGLLEADTAKAARSLLRAQALVPLAVGEAVRFWMARPGAVDEWIYDVVERVPLGGTGAQRQDAWVLATNVYVRTPLGWRMVAHHASPGMAHAPSNEPHDPPATLH